MGRLQEILTVPLSKEELFENYKKRIKDSNKNSFIIKAAYIKKNLPDINKEIIEKAELAMQGMLVLPSTGGKPFFVGNPPAWHENRTNDNEYVWLLNRMEHWKTLMQAYSFTKDKRYPEKTLDEFKDWIEKCPRPDIDKSAEELLKVFFSPSPWRSLETGLRMTYHWPIVINELINADYITPEFFEKFMISVYEHGEVLEKVCPAICRDKINNHYVLENLALLNLAYNFPEFKKSEQWIKHAIRELEITVDQFTDDGGQIEGCPDYHNCCIRIFYLTIKIARENGFSFSSKYRERIRKAVDYSIYTFRPSGTIVPWGDSGPNISAVEAAIYGYLAFDDTKWLRIISGIMGFDWVADKFSKYVWDIPDIDCLKARLKNELDMPFDEMLLYNYQKNLNQFTARTDWSGNALSFFFCCRTPVHNGHAHIDPMSFDFTALGKAFIVDPGKFNYAETEIRKLFKSAASHSTLMIDDKEPFEYISSWHFGPQKDGYISNIYKGDNFIASEALQKNYEPIIHKRLITLVDNSFLLVLDKLDELDNNSVKIYYHIDSANVLLDKEKYIAYTNDDKVNILIKNTTNMDSCLLEGKISEVSDTFKASTRLCLSDNSGGKGTKTYAAVLVPFTAKNIPQLSAIVTEINKNCCIYKFEYLNKKYYFEWGKNKFEMV